MNDHSQIRIVLSSVGMEKIELFATPEDNDSEELAIGLYNKLAIAIHQFSRRVKLILDSPESEENEALDDCDG